MQRGLDDLAHDALRRVEGGGGALGDVGDVAAAEIGEGAFGEREHVGGADADVAFGDAAAAAGVAHQGEASGGLAGAGFADQRQDLAAGDAEVEIV